MTGELPKTLTVGEVEYTIRTNYRNILRLFDALSDPELYPEEKQIVSVYMIFRDFSCADDVEAAVEAGFDIVEAVKQIAWFIAAGRPEKKDDFPTYSWKQDEQMIFSSINKVAGTETREQPYLHWWTFIGYFNEIEEGTLTFIMGIRNKRNKGKRLEKHEEEFLSKHKELVEIRPILSKEEQEQEDAFQALVDEVLG